MGVSQKARFTISALATTMQPSAFGETGSATQAERRLAVGRAGSAELYSAGSQGVGQVKGKISTERRPSGAPPHPGTERRPGGAPTCSRQETPAWASPQKHDLQHPH